MKQRAFGETSILADTATTSPEKQRCDLSVEIVRYIATTKQAEANAKTLAAAKQSERQRLDALIRDREGKETPLEELRKQRDALEA